MATAPDTPTLLNAILAICQSLQITVNSVPSNAFGPNSVQIGKFKDVTDVAPCCEITASDPDNTDRARYAVGGKIDDSQEFLVEITAGLANATNTELLLAQLRDTFTAKFNSLARLNNTPNVQHSALAGPGHRGYTFREGQWYRCYRNSIFVRYEYSVTITP